MVTIIFESHATSLDNEAGLSSGWYNVKLSDRGKLEAHEMSKRRDLKEFAAVFCSDLERSYETAKLAFTGINTSKLKIDWRLRECNYGDYTRHPKDEVDTLKPKMLDIPFPNGESYNRTADRMRSFMEDLFHFYDNQTVMVIGHQATQYGLALHVNGIPLLESINAKWKWHPGWEYKLFSLSNHH